MFSGPPTQGQIVQFLGRVNQFLREANKEALQRLVEGMDLVETVAYSKESLPDLRKRLNLGFLTLVDYNLTVYQMSAESCCKVEDSLSDAGHQFLGLGRTLVLFEFLKLSKEELGAPKPIKKTIREKGFRPAMVHEFFSFLRSYCGIISKDGSRLIAAEHLFQQTVRRGVYKTLPEIDLSRCYWVASWKSQKLYAELVPIRLISPEDVFLVVRTGNPISE